MIPLVILLMELAVTNAYLGLLLASIPEVRDKYSWSSSYLLANAGCVMFGLMFSMVWLAGYRIWLTCHGKSKVIEKMIVDRLQSETERPDDQLSSESQDQQEDGGTKPDGGRSFASHATNHERESHRQGSKGSAVLGDADEDSA